MNDRARERLSETNRSERVASIHIHIQKQPYYRAIMVVLAITVLLAVFWPTFLSMAAIWWRSETFTHGFFIFPISAWLIWRQRRILSRVPPGTDFRALLLLAFLGFAWGLANAVDVLVVKQYAFVAMIPAVCWLLLGWPWIRTVGFPLAFLLLAVPVGEGLIPPMMEFTASFTVRALQLTGVPVYWEGLFFTLPTGRWSIVEGCSGVRYLIASVTIGCMYAYLTYRSLWRRAVFVLLSAAVPIIGNGLRAYIIVMIGHLSDMRLATGVDHIVYGWVFFGILMLFLFWVGSYWREDTDHDQSRKPTDSSDDIKTDPIFRPLAALGAGLVIIAVWPIWGWYVDAQQALGSQVDLATPVGGNGWTASDVALTSWKPRYLAPTKEIRQTYENNQSRVGLYLAYYMTQSQGAELINSQNVMVVQKHSVWRQPSQQKIGIESNGSRFKIIETYLKSADQNLLVWHWNWIGGRFTSSPYIGKLLEAKNRLFLGQSASAAIVVYTQYAEDPGSARPILQKFVDEMTDRVSSSLQLASTQERFVSSKKHSAGQ